MSVLVVVSDAATVDPFAVKLLRLRIVVSLLVSVTGTPDTGASKVSVNGTFSPAFTVDGLAATDVKRPGRTTIVFDALTPLSDAEIVIDCGAATCTVLTVNVAVLPDRTTVAGTEATVGLDEDRSTVAGPAR